MGRIVLVQVLTGVNCLRVSHLWSALSVIQSVTTDKMEIKSVVNFQLKYPNLFDMLLTLSDKV